MFIGGNAITLLRSGAEYFPAVTDAIDQARRSAYIETCIFAGDASGERVADALERRLRTAAVLIVLYRQDLFEKTWRCQRLRRLHRKLVVIDGESAFVGGINMIDDMNTPGQTPPRIDIAIRVEGPICCLMSQRCRGYGGCCG